MQKVISFIKKVFEKYFWLLVVLIILADLALRLWHLNYPNWLVFDEIYYVKYANNYLQGISFFDVHPPLGKLLIALSIYLFGDNVWGWRLAEAIFGTGLITVIFFFSLKLFKNKLTAFLALTLASFCSLSFVESRLGLINIFLAFFTTLGFYLFWCWYESKNKWLFLAALVIFALSASVKWTGFLALIACLAFFAFIIWQDPPMLNYWQKHRRFIYFGIFIFLVVYATIFYIKPASNQFDIVNWHKQALSFQLNLKAGHPYAARWWTWPLGIRPIWLEFKKIADNSYIPIIEIINIPLIYIGIISFFYGLYLAIKKIDQRLIYLCLAALILYLPFAFVRRVTFLYLFLPVMPILILLSAKFLSDLSTVFHKSKLTLLAVLLIAGFFIYFFPLMIGQPVSYATYFQHMWLKSWY